MRTRWVMATIAVASVLALAAGCASGGDDQVKQTAKPGPTVTATSSPSSEPLASHGPSEGERMALAAASRIVDNPGGDEEKEHLKPYAGKHGTIIGYVVQCRGPGMLLAVLVEAPAGTLKPATYVWDPWPAESSDGAGERWAMETVTVKLKSWLESEAAQGFVPSERRVCGYVVGWPDVGPMTMWIDSRGNLRGGEGLL